MLTEKSWQNSILKIWPYFFSSKSWYLQLSTSWCKWTIACTRARQKLCQHKNINFFGCGVWVNSPSKSASEFNDHLSNKRGKDNTRPKVSLQKKTKSKSHFLNFLRGFNSLSHATSPHLLEGAENFDVLKFFKRVDSQHHCNALQAPFMFWTVWNLFHCHFDNPFSSKILDHSYEVFSLHKAVKTAHAWIRIDTCFCDYVRNFASSVKWFHSNACLD